MHHSSIFVRLRNIVLFLETSSIMDFFFVVTILKQLSFWVVIIKSKKSGSNIAKAFGAFSHGFVHTDYSFYKVTMDLYCSWNC